MEQRRMPDAIRQHMIRTRGADYLPVAFRLVWFRDECPDWTIQTELVDGGYQHGYALMRAVVSDASGRVISTAHKVEDSTGFADFLEKAETGAIGRALAIAGYGTQFAPDISGADDSDDPVDAPARPPARKPSSQPRPQPVRAPQSPPHPQQTAEDPAHAKRVMFDAASGYGIDPSAKGWLSDLMRRTADSSQAVRDLYQERKALSDWTAADYRAVVEAMHTWHRTPRDQRPPLVGQNPESPWCGTREEADA